MRNAMTQEELNEALIAAAVAVNPDEVARLVKLGAGVDVEVDNVGRQPLHWVAELGCKDAVELLIAMGAKVDATDRDGWQPLHYAARKGHRIVAELLIDKGAKVDAADDSGSQPLHDAAWSGSRDVVELLIARGAQVEAADNDGNRPLHYAARRGNRDMVELLLAYGANPVALNKHGEVPRIRCRNRKIRGLLKRASLEWKTPALREAREQKALAAHLARQRQLGKMRKPAPTL